MRSRVDSWRQALRRRSGIDVHRHPHVATREGHLRHLLAHLSVDVVIDVGANRGQFAQLLRQDSRFGGRIVSFEPDPSTFRSLAAAARNDRLWECHQSALGNVEGTAILRQFEGNDTWNSLHDPHDANLSGAGRSLSRVSSVEVPISTIDALWPTLLGGSSTPFLKVDAQGGDIEVLEGASTHLGNFAGILVEASLLPFYDAEPQFADVIVWFASRGWTPSGFFPVARSRESLALHTVDVTFVKSIARV